MENKEACCESVVEKIKVTKADIVVRGTANKPYFSIVYREAGKDYDSLGYGSYYLDNVFKWRDEDLELVEEQKQNRRTKCLRLLMEKFTKIFVTGVLNMLSW